MRCRQLVSKPGAEVDLRHVRSKPCLYSVSPGLRSDVTRATLGVSKRLLAGLSLAFVLASGARSSAQSQPDEATLKQGAAVYQYWCATCHAAGRGMPGTAALAAKYKGRQPGVPAALDARTDLTPQSIRLFVRKGVSVMAPFRKTEISDGDLNALVVHLTRPRP